MEARSLKTPAGLKPYRLTPQKSESHCQELTVFSVAHVLLWLRKDLADFPFDEFDEAASAHFTAAPGYASQAWAAVKRGVLRDIFRDCANAHEAALVLSRFILDQTLYALDVSERWLKQIARQAPDTPTALQQVPAALIAKVEAAAEELARKLLLVGNLHALEAKLLERMAKERVHAVAKQTEAERQRQLLAAMQRLADTARDQADELAHGVQQRDLAACQEKLLTARRSTTEQVIRWARPNTISHWAMVFGVRRRTMKQQLDNQTVRNRRFGALYQIAVDDLPVPREDVSTPPS
jgi:hypothetical protein